MEERKEEQKEPQAKTQVQEKPKAEEKPKVKLSKKMEDDLKTVEGMSVMELADLVHALEDKFGVSTAAPVAAAAPAVAAPGTAAPAAEEKSVFNIELTAPGDKKIEVIKVVRDATEKGLKEAKDLVDAAASAPQMVKENVKKEEAEELKKKFEAAGAKVELK